jgi:hypothetical protein
MEYDSNTSKVNTKVTDSVSAIVEKQTNDNVFYKLFVNNKTFYADFKEVG